MNFVFDTNVLISATGWEGSVSEKLLLKIVELGLKVFTSQEILLEFHKVLVRDFDYTQDKASEKIDGLLPIFTIVEAKEKVDVVKADPDDNKIIECAIASNSNYIVTYDKHLLEIKNFRGMKIVKPEELLRIL